jgi:protocatechuate 3,4-dioxygenase, beta subunit
MIRDDNPAPEDEGFQGYGQTTTGGDGGYRFRASALSRPHGPHPFQDQLPGPRRTGDADVAGEQRNATDGVLNNIDVTARERVIVSLMPAPEIEANALKAAFDIVLGDDRAGGRKLR